MPHEALSRDTLAVVTGRPGRAPGTPVSPDIELSSTYVSWGPYGFGESMYARGDNATWKLFEEAVGTLEGAPQGAVAFPSGMAAGTAILELIPDGGRLVMADTCYNTMLALASERAASGRLTLTTVDASDTAAVVAALPGADWLLLESPTNPLLQIADLGALCAAARQAGVRVGVDNTFATPMLQNPLALGADVVMHSATKYLSGHSDVLLGVVIASDTELAGRVRQYRTVQGSIPGPMETWLALRGLRTLAVRLERAQASAGVLAERLAAHPAVSRVRYPGLPDDPGHSVAQAQMRGFGGMLAIEVAGGEAAAQAVVEAVRLWVPATSLGGVESLIERRRRIPSEPVSVPENLLRLSVGLEDVEDLWADLRQALDTV